MATRAGVDMIWNLEWTAIHLSGDLIKPLEDGIADMVLNPDKYQPLSASNGWGTYEQFIPWLQKLLEACRQCPNAEIVIYT